MDGSAHPREWDAGAYHAVSGPQVAWGLRVLDRVRLAGDERVVDAGCGTGRLTAHLLERLPAGQVLCLDRSFNMVHAAHAHLAPRFAGRVRAVCADLLALPVHGWADVIVSTATFHWVPDHERLFAGLFEALRPGGRLVAQCGGAGNLARTHAVIERVMAVPRFAPAFASWTDPWEFATPDTTVARLRRAGFVEAKASLEDAPTPFPDARAFTAFVVPVVLRPFVARLTGDVERQAFIEAVAAEAGRADPPFHLDYVRLNLEARRPGHAAARVTRVRPFSRPAPPAAPR
jgi:trans-aconitate methyltransferase